MKLKIFTLLFTVAIGTQLYSYPIDGFKETGIDRLAYLWKVYQDSLQEGTLKPGALKMTDEIKLNLYEKELGWPETNPELEQSLRNIFRYLEPQYSISVMDITNPDEIRYAGLKEEVQYQPGSVAKMIAGLALFNELHRVYGDDWSKIQSVLYNRFVQGNDFVHADHHTIPIYDIEEDKYYKRIAKSSDVFSLYEWLDHMYSKSSNAAASVVMREALLLHIMDRYYECATQEEMDDLLEETDRNVLAALMEDVSNCGLETIGIDTDLFRVGGLFTNGAERFIPRKGGSTGSTKALLQYMFKIEQGKVLSPRISLELKRLMYLTDRRIRYAASHALDSSAVYFKSGSLYSFKPEPGFVRRKYAGNRYNYMNSVAVVERPDSLGGQKYLVALMSNVLRKNSVGEHYALAKRIDDLIVQHYESKKEEI